MIDEKERFFAQNAPLVHSLCRRYTGKGIDYEELYAAGCLGLVKAYNNYDEQRGCAFSTYAVPVILGEIRALFRGGSVSVSRSARKLSHDINALMNSGGGEMSVSAAAAKLGVDPVDAAQAVSSCAETLSLSREDGTLIDIADDERGEIIELKVALSRLTDDERRLIILRYFKGMTQAETALILGHSQVGVSRREKAALARLRLFLQ